MTESIRETLAAAAAEVEQAAAESAPEVASPVESSAPTGDAPDTSEASAPEGGPSRDEKGRFATKAEKEAAEKGSVPPKPATTSSPHAAKLAEAGPPAAPNTQAVSEVKAPQAWKPTLREKWAGLPREVQEEVHRREREIAHAMQESAEARKHLEAFRATVAPFEGFIRAEGSEPMRAVGNLLQTAAALRTAPPAQKAALVANLVKQFGIPIDALDAALAGQPGPQGGNTPPSPYMDPRVDQLFQRLQQAEAQRAEQLKTQGQQALESFAQGHEFFDDLREDMADLMEAATKRGKTLSLEDAYTRASMLHPEISQVLQQREAAKAAANANASTQKSRIAASSVKTHPTAQMNGAQTGSSIRAAIEAADASLAGR